MLEYVAAAAGLFLSIVLGPHRTLLLLNLMLSPPAPVYYESADPVYENFPAAADAIETSSDPLSSDLSPNETYAEIEVIERQKSESELMTDDENDA